LKNKNKLYPYKKLSAFYNTCLKNFGPHLVWAGRAQSVQRLATSWTDVKVRVEL